MARSNTYPADLRDRLLVAAYRHLSWEPPESMSLRLLAASENTSTNAIYSIFGSKDALIAAVVERARADFLTQQLSEVGDPPTLQALIDSGRAYRAWARRQPALYRLMFGGTLGYEIGPDVITTALAPLIAVLEELMDTDQIARRTAPGVAMSLWSATHGFILLEMNLWPDGGAEVDALFEEHLQGMAFGFSNAPSLAGRC